VELLCSPKLSTSCEELAMAEWCLIEATSRKSQSTRGDGRKMRTCPMYTEMHQYLLYSQLLPTHGDADAKS
jgi:hypothetical protein